MKDTFYTCPYCKEEYNSPVDLAHCILSCEEKKRVEEEKKQKEKLEAERKARVEEVEAAEQHYIQLLRRYIRDYGSYSKSREYQDNTDGVTYILKTLGF